MERYNIYQDIAERTDGDIYIGVVGPVRTGKSTFIKKFMENLVLPNIQNVHKRERATDEMPQSSSGRTIMTTEPKFVPNEAVEVELEDNAVFRVRLIDCVGYIVPTALGYIEDEMPRMVHTPWDSQPMPFNAAAELGTRKVINEHSTIGLLVTTDGSFGEIPREDYVNAEERVVAELKAIRKPFVVLINSAVPESVATQELRDTLEEKYNVPVLAVNCIRLEQEDIKQIIESVLFEFPVREITVMMPGWIDALPTGHWLRDSVYKSICDAAAPITRVREVGGAKECMAGNQNLTSVAVTNIDLGKGSAKLELRPADGLFYRILGEATGLEVDDEESLMVLMQDFSRIKRQYDKVSSALEEVAEKGYGIVSPTIDELKLEEPEIVKQGGRFGVRLRASAPSIHMIRADIETEVSPIVGSERQSEELLLYMLKEFEENPQKIWDSNLFGKSIHELVNEGLHNKLFKMPEDARCKLQNTLTRIVNEGSGGLICIIL